MVQRETEGGKRKEEMVWEKKTREEQQRQRKEGRQRLRNKLPRPTSPPCQRPPACEPCVMAQLCQHPGQAGFQAAMALSGYHYPHSLALVTWRFFLLLWPTPQTCAQVPLCLPPAWLLVPPDCRLLRSPLHRHGGPAFAPRDTSPAPKPFSPPPVSLWLGSPFLV